MLPVKFTYPFRYTPHPLVEDAARRLIADIQASPELAAAFAEGKMLGVMVCAKTVEYQAGIQQQFERREVRKTYLAHLCAGSRPWRGRLELYAESLSFRSPVTGETETFSL